MKTTIHKIIVFILLLAVPLALFAQEYSFVGVSEHYRADGKKLYIQTEFGIIWRWNVQ